MPKKVLPSRLAYRGFESFLNKHRWVLLDSAEEARELTRLGIMTLEHPPRKQESIVSDVWTLYTPHGYHARIRTSVSTKNGFDIMDNKPGWGMIVYGDDQVYSTQPLHRTKYFLENMWMESIILEYAVRNRPLCSRCKSNMILTNPAVREYVWVCRNNERYVNHPHVERNFYQPFFDLLPKEVQHYINKKKSKDAYYQKLCDEKGIEYGSATKNRIPWPLENIE